MHCEINSHGKHLFQTLTNEQMNVELKLKFCTFKNKGQGIFDVKGTS